MRLAMSADRLRMTAVRTALASAAALALAACAGQSAAVPVTSSATSGISGNVLQPLGVVDDALVTCATSPPQYGWIFKGACEPKITVKPTGGTFKLGTYDDITVTGSIGQNNVKGTATVALVDATDTNGDVEKYQGKVFPAYHGKGKVFVYASAINQSSQTIKPIAEKNKPILKYVITDSKGLPGKQCGAAILTSGSKGSTLWESIPATLIVKGDTVTITQYAVPKGFEFPPKAPLY